MLSNLCNWVVLKMVRTFKAFHNKLATIYKTSISNIFQGKSTNISLVPLG